MAKYKVTKPSFINNVYYKEGDVVEWDGEAGDNLEKVGKPKKADAPQDDAPAEDQPLA